LARLLEGQRAAFYDIFSFDAKWIFCGDGTVQVRNIFPIPAWKSLSSRPNTA